MKLDCQISGFLSLAFYPIMLNISLGIILLVLLFFIILKAANAINQSICWNNCFLKILPYIL